jgi:hypothetical protein
MIPMHALSPTRRASSLGAVALPLPQPATLILTNWRQSEKHISNKAERVREMGISSGCLQANSIRTVSTPVHSADRRYAYRPYRPPLVHARSATEGCSRRRPICSVNSHSCSSFDKSNQARMGVAYEQKSFVRGRYD